MPTEEVSKKPLHKIVLKTLIDRIEEMAAREKHTAKNEDRKYIVRSEIDLLCGIFEASTLPDEEIPTIVEKLEFAMEMCGWFEHRSRVMTLIDRISPGWYKPNID